LGLNRVFAIWEIGCREMAFEKLNFGKTDIQVNRFWKLELEKLELGKMDFWGKKY